MESGVRFRVNKKVVYELFDDELVIINLDNGNYYTLAQLGADIWKLLDAGASLDEVLGALAGRYTGEASDIQHALAQFVLDLEGENLISLDGSRLTPPQVAETAAPTGTDRPAFEPPVLEKYTDMQALLLLDPIHEVDEMGWPSAKPVQEG